MRIGSWPTRVIKKDVRKQVACHPCCFFTRVSTSVRKRVCEHSHESSIVRRLTGKILTLALPGEEYRDSWASPRKRLAVSEETTTGAIVGQCCCPYDSLSALGNRTRSTRAAHLRCNPTRTHGVYQDASITEFPCECAGQGIQTGLGDLICRRASAHARKRS